LYYFSLKDSNWKLLAGPISGEQFNSPFNDNIHHKNAIERLLPVTLLLKYFLTTIYTLYANFFLPF
jgi:hypothetical protein